jgi:hypothetical protein
VCLGLHEFERSERLARPDRVPHTIDLILTLGGLHLTPPARLPLGWNPAERFQTDTNTPRQYPPEGISAGASRFEEARSAQKVVRSLSA